MEQGQEKKTVEKSAIIVNFSSSSFEIFLRPCVNSPPPNLSHEKKGKNETKFPENKKYEGKKKKKKGHYNFDHGLEKGEEEGNEHGRYNRM